MFTVKVPIFNSVYRGVDGIELNDKSFQLYDGYLDEAGGTIRRPGLSSFVDLGTNRPVDGVFWWPQKSKLLAVSNGKIFSVSPSGSGGAATDLTGAPLLAGNKVSFTTDGTYCFMANGGKIVYTDGTTATQYIADADAPTQVTHLGYIDGYIMANSVGTQKFYYSDVNNSLSWSALSFASVGGNSDNLLGFKIVNREIFFFGSISAEIWENDGSTPFARIPGGFFELGCAAPNSLVVADTKIFWLDHNRRFAMFDGKQWQTFPSSFDKEIKGLSTVTGCMGDYIEVDGKSFILWHFPDGNVTIALCLSTNSWSKWGAYDSQTQEYNRFLGQNATYCIDWGLNVVGSRSSSIVYSLTPSNLTDAGTPIRLSRISGNVDYGTSRNKRSQEFRIRLKRGEGTSSAAPTLMFRWRTNGSAWSNFHSIDLGNAGDTDIVSRVFRTGMIRTRQYEFTATDNVPIIFSDAEEDIEILR